MNPFFTGPAQASLDRAAVAAAQREQRTVEPRHILLGLLDFSSGSFPEVLDRVGVEVESLREAVTRSLPRTRRDEPPSSTPELPYTRRAEGVLETAREEAKEDGRTQVGATDIFVALATEKGITRTLLEEFGLDDARVRQAVEAVSAGGAPTEEAPPEEATDATGTEAPPGDDGGPASRESRETGPREPPGTPPRDERPGPETGASSTPDSTPAFRSGFDRSTPPGPGDEYEPAGEEDVGPDDGGRSGPLAAFRDTLGSILSPRRQTEDRPPDGEVDHGDEEPAPAETPPIRTVEPAEAEEEQEEQEEQDDEERTPVGELEWEPRPSETPSAPAKEATGESSPMPEEAALANVLRIDDGSDPPIYEQIIRGVEEAVATGELASGERLPSIRQLADALSVSPGTTAKAYRELERRNVVVTRGRRGTYVASRGSGAPSRDERIRSLADELRPAVVDAYHMGAGAEELEAALRKAMQGILE